MAQRFVQAAKYKALGDETDARILVETVGAATVPAAFDASDRSAYNNSPSEVLASLRGMPYDDFTRTEEAQWDIFTDYLKDNASRENANITSPTADPFAPRGFVAAAAAANGIRGTMSSVAAGPNADHDFDFQSTITQVYNNSVNQLQRQVIEWFMRALVAAFYTPRVGAFYLWPAVARVLLGVAFIVASFVGGASEQGKFLVPIYYDSPDYLQTGFVQAYNILNAMGIALMGSGIFGLFIGGFALGKAGSSEIFFDIAIWGKSVPRGFLSLSIETLAIWVVSQICGIGNLSLLVTIVVLRAASTFADYKMESDNSQAYRMRQVLYARKMAGNTNTEKFNYTHPHMVPFNYTSIVVSWFLLVGAWIFIFLSAGYYGQRLNTVESADAAFVESSHYWLVIAIPVFGAAVDIGLKLALTLRYAGFEIFGIVKYIAGEGRYDNIYNTVSFARDLFFALCIGIVGFPAASGFGNLIYI